MRCECYRFLGYSALKSVCEPTYQRNVFCLTTLIPYSADFRSIHIRTTRRCIPEYANIHNYRRENLKPNNVRCNRKSKFFFEDDIYRETHPLILP
jgi:hypothetical protein